MDDSVRFVTPDYVSLIITTSGEGDNCSVERRFPKSTTISDLKGKLELQTGGSAATMKLELYDKEDTLIAKLDSNDAMLGMYVADNGMRLHVVDNFTLKKVFEDTADVEKFHLDPDAYEKRTDSIRYFLKKNKLGKYNEAEMAAREEARKKEMEAEIELAKSFKVGDRCEVTVPDSPVRRGCVKYLGELRGKQGWWVGVQFDEPLGKNNGSVNGVSYFECPPNYGAFVRPIYVKVGDFPEVDPLDDEL